MKQFTFMSEETFRSFTSRDNIGVRYLGTSRFLVDYRTKESDGHPSVYAEKEPLTFIPAPEDERREILNLV